MQMFLLTDICCPCTTLEQICGGQLELAEEVLKPAFLPTDANEMVEGLLQCQSCGQRFPVVCGLPILQEKPWRYLRDNYRAILSLAAETDLSVSRPMIELLHNHQADVGAVTKGENKYDTPSTLSIYLSQHYDHPWKLVSDDHPLRLITESLYTEDFYSATFNSIAPYLSADQKALDIGCSVGRSIYELAGHCGVVYGVEYSFVSAFLARRVLRHFPAMLTSYWLQWDGDFRFRRPLRNYKRDNAEVIVASGQSLPFRKSNFAVVNSLNVIDRVPSPEKLLTECDRVLESQGLLCLSDPYCWESQYTPLESWIGGRTELRSADALRKRIQQMADIIVEADKTLWLTVKHERSWDVLIPHVLVARKRSADKN